MVFATSSAEILEGEYLQNPRGPFFKQVVTGILSLALGFCVHKIRLSSLIAHAKPLSYALFFLLLLVFVPGIGMSINGAHRWINLHFLALQPSEFMKVIFPIYLVSLGRPSNFIEFAYLVLLAFIPIFLILIEPDNGSALILLATFLIYLFLIKVPFRYWLVPLMVIFMLGVSVVCRMDHVKNRLAVYLDPEKDLRGKGHQPYQAKIAAGSGGVWGRGFGQSLQKFRYLPEARSDYIAAIFAEEFGFVGVVFLTVAYMAFLLSGFVIALSRQQESEAIVIALLTLVIGMGAFINLGVALGMLPSKGMNLPFISQGGSSLMASTSIIAMLISGGSRVKKIG